MINTPRVHRHARLRFKITPTCDEIFCYPSGCDLQDLLHDIVQLYIRSCGTQQLKQFIDNEIKDSDNG